MLPPVLEKVIVPSRVNVIPTEGPLRLNLGGVGDGKSGKIPGFLMVDLQDILDVDVVADCSDLHMFKDDSVSEVYASNILEHFKHLDSVNVLKEWCRILKPGSTCWISVPDMDANFRLYKQYGLVPWVVNIIWGDQYHPYAFHYVNFTFASLAKCVLDAGFSDIKRLQTMPFGLPDGAAHVDSKEGTLVSLNVRAIK